MPHFFNSLTRLGICLVICLPPLSLSLSLCQFVSLLSLWLSLSPTHHCWSSIPYFVCVFFSLSLSYKHSRYPCRYLWQVDRDEQKYRPKWLAVVFIKYQKSWLIQSVFAWKNFKIFGLLGLLLLKSSLYLTPISSNHSYLVSYHSWRNEANVSYQIFWLNWIEHWFL